MSNYAWSRERDKRGESRRRQQHPPPTELHLSSFIVSAFSFVSKRSFCILWGVTQGLALYPPFLLLYISLPPPCQPAQNDMVMGGRNPKSPLHTTTYIYAFAPLPILLGETSPPPLPRKRILTEFETAIVLPDTAADAGG